MTDCIFCKIVAGEIPADTVYEDDKVLAFLDVRPSSPGHTLLIPKEHTADIVSADNTAIADGIIQTKRIAAAIQQALNADGFTISTNRGEAAGQSVFHLHFHIIPRYSQPAAQTERTQVAELIRKAL